MPKNAQEKNYKDLNYSIKSKIKIKNLKVLFYPLLEKNKLPQKIYSMLKNMEFALLTAAGIESNKLANLDSNIKGNLFLYLRKLPFVTAGNPVNYGKPYQLSCAQALATALCTIGYCEQAQYIMSKFGWADGFWSLNPLI